MRLIKLILVLLTKPDCRIIRILNTEYLICDHKQLMHIKQPNEKLFIWKMALK